MLWRRFGTSAPLDDPAMILEDIDAAVVVDQPSEADRRRVDPPIVTPRISRRVREDVSVLRGSPPRRVAFDESAVTRHGLAGLDDTSRQGGHGISSFVATSVPDPHPSSYSRGSLMSQRSLSTTDLRAAFNAHYSQPQSPRGQK